MTGNEPPAQPATPPAADPAGGNNQLQATPPASVPGQNPPQPGEGNIWTPAHQEIFDRRFAEKMGTIERELGIQPGGLKDYVATQKAAQKPKPPTGETLSGADLKIAKMEALMIAGVPSQQIPVILQHFNIAGKTREEIQGSIQQLIEAKLLTIAPLAPEPGITQQQPPAITGAGANPANPAGQPAKKIWTESEIRELRLSGQMTDELHAQITLAAREGRVK